MWTIFGSALAWPHRNPKFPNATYGNSCQRNGVMYKWIFDGETGGYLCVVTVDGIRADGAPNQRKR